MPIENDFFINIRKSIWMLNRNIVEIFRYTFVFIHDIWSIEITISRYI